MLYTGKEFKKKYPNSEFYKLTTLSERHNGFQFKTGLNKDTIPFNPSGECLAGGLYFIDKHNIEKWLSYGSKNMYWFRKVKLDDKCLVYEEEEKYKANYYILSERKYLYDDYEIAKQIISDDGLKIKYIKDKNILSKYDYEICKIAVQQNGNALYHIKNQTYELCKLAVQNKGTAIQFVEKKFKTKELCELAIKQNEWAKLYIGQENLTKLYTNIK